MRSAILAAGFCLAGGAQAQLDVPVHLQLNGPVDAQRQVTGLADPTEPGSGMSVDAVRANAATFAMSSGSQNLIANLTPAPSGYTAGMVITLVPDSTCSAGPTLNLNGNGPRSILKNGTLPLDSADLHAGEPVRLMYDGLDFQLIGASTLPCPAGFHVGGREYCIEDSSRSPLSFVVAMNDCINHGGRLCSFAEWVHGCEAQTGFIGTVSDYEWVDCAANNTGNAKRVGYGDDGSGNVGFGCRHGHHTAPATPTRYRCCMSR
ncbi:MAG: hypothetical protein IT226_02290 [Flavobacteriales bacterium]|nr:hypothetical protein [Flavobacteriales bacterium]